MSMEEQDNKYVINVAEVTRVYRLYEKPIDRLEESMNILHRDYHRDFYTLNQLSFGVREGETVGIIGTDGPDKSTILKIITGVPAPTTGEVRVDGKTSALLGPGAGLNMGYTEIENIYMNGTMMDYTKKEMDAKPQDILEFAEIRDFVYQPVETYSNGMFIRLAFALAVNVDPEILIVDGALSVGDMPFQSKCYRRMEEVHQKRTTILMTIHDVRSIIRYCDRAVLLNKGEFIAESPADRVVDMYKEILAGQLDALKAELERERQQKESLTGEIGQENAGSEVLTRVGTKRTETTGSRVRAGTKSGGAGMSDFSGGTELGGSRLMKDQLIINYGHTECGDGRAEIMDLGLFDERGNITSPLLEGEMFTIKERTHFNTEIQSPIFTYTIKDKKGTELIDTSAMFEGAEIQPVERGDEHVVEFTQKMILQGGEYLLGMSCIGFEQEEYVMYHHLYNVTSITVISNKNTVGAYGMESRIRAVKVEVGKIEVGNAGPTVSGGL